MSNTKDLKEYLIGEDGFLLNDMHNGKTIMLSGAWGSGKTHFWQNDIETKLTTELNKDDKACVYVSLYGKDNIDAIKNEILFKAYESIKDENKLAKRAISAFGFSTRLLSVSAGGIKANTGAIGNIVEGFFESKKIEEAEAFLADGGLVCLDDFERKSIDIDLNDLFGFITQLATDMQCKIVIILNSDVFEGDEANVFKAVKEKTVNKYLKFEPTRRELFDTIINANNERYKTLGKYKDTIFNAIDESEELNARIYIQILDNCVEWINKGYDDSVIRTLVLNTVCFIQNNFCFELL
ncbi:MAG: P-loop NTPase fold protein [Sulfurovum sp.]